MQCRQALAMFHSGILFLNILGLGCCFFLLCRDVSSETWTLICLLAYVIVCESTNQGSSHTKSLELWQLLPQGRVLLSWKVCKILHTCFNYLSLYKKIIKIKNINTIDTKSLNIWYMVKVMGGPLVFPVLAGIPPVYSNFTYVVQLFPSVEILWDAGIDIRIGFVICSPEDHYANP